MAKIIENQNGRRSIRLSTDDIISVVKEYQNLMNCENNYLEIRSKLEKLNFYLPEDLY